MLHIHHADPGDDDPLTWDDEIHGDMPGLLPADVRDPIDVLRGEVEMLRTQLLQVRIAMAQLAAAFHRLESVLSEGA